MRRKTNYIVFIDKSELDDPDALFDAAISHLIKKGCDPKQRKRFLTQFLKAFTHDEKMGVVTEWVQVRDAATYPFRNKSKAAIAEEGTTETQTTEEVTDEDKGAEGGVSVDDGTDPEPESGAASE